MLSKRRPWLILILLLAFALRAWDIDARSLWFDEAVEYWSANAPLWALPDNVVTTYQPPLYTYVLHVWLKFGMEAVWLRFLSVELSMLTIVGIMTWGYRLFGLRGALVAGGVAAILPSEVRYAQEVGEYALMECALTWALNFLDCTFRNLRWRWWGLWGLFSVVSVCSHYGTSIVLTPLALISLLENLGHGRKQAVLRQTVVSAISLLLCLPVIGYFFPRQVQGLVYNAPTLPVHALSAEIAGFFDSIGNTFLFQLTGWPFSTLPKSIGGIGIAVILAFSLIILVNPATKIQKRSLRWLLVAYVCYFAGVRSGLYGHGSYGFRYGLILAPPFILAVAGSIEQLVRWRRRFVALVALSVFVGLGVYSLPNRTLSQFTRGKQAWPETQDVREVTQYWMEHRTQNDPTYVYYGAVPAFRYYLQSYGLDTDPLPPHWYGACWKGESACPNRGNVFFGAWLRRLKPPAKVESIERTLGVWPQQLWLIFSHIHSDEDQQILDLLEEMGYSRTLSDERENASTYLLQRK